MNKNRYRLRSSVAVVEHETHVEFFKTGNREATSIKINIDDLFSILQLFDGRTPLSNILQKFDFSDQAKEQAKELVRFLNKKSILIEEDESYPEHILEQDYRLIGFLEDYSQTTSQVISRIKRLNRSRVAIFGLGAVGTWVCESLAMAGVKNFVLVDPDHVEASNLHRQEMFFEHDLGQPKVLAAKKRLERLDRSLNVEVYVEKLDRGLFIRKLLQFDAAINCADSPNVDTTSRFLGKECMSRGTPHLIGGGYNLHLSLVGQTVIPGRTSCVNCYELQTSENQETAFDGIEKLYRPNRKIGSFSPLCTLSASITSEETIKTLLGLHNSLITKNARLEYDLRSKTFRREQIEAHPKCTWCMQAQKTSFISGREE